MAMTAHETRQVTNVLIRRGGRRVKNASPVRPVHLPVPLVNWAKPIIEGVGSRVGTVGIDLSPNR